MFANSSMMGMDFCMIPDFCKTPPVGIPLPYPNIALAPMGVPPAFKVLLVGAPAHNMMTVIPMSFGDEPGLMGGLISGIIKGSSRKLTGAFTTLFMGLPATRLTSLCLMNLCNTLGMTVVPSQVKVLVLK